jgi:hypothetical protein
MYYRARYYDPDTGRFLKHDPLGYVDGMNLYEYGNSNPTMHTDPSGLLSCSSWLPKLKPCGSYTATYAGRDITFETSGRCPPGSKIYDKISKEAEKKTKEELPISGSTCEEGTCKCIFKRFGLGIDDVKSGSDKFCWDPIGGKSREPDANGGCKGLLWVGPCTVEYEVTTHIKVIISIGLCCK